MKKTRPRTIVEKILDMHTVCEQDGRALVYIDRLITADTALPTFEMLRDEGRPVRRPAQTIMVPDHFTPSSGAALEDVVDDERRVLIAETNSAARRFGIEVWDLGDRRRGIQHTVAVEQAFAQPGITVAAGDSHTATQGALGALAFSLSFDLGHALATQCFWLKVPPVMRIALDGKPQLGITPKDVALAILSRIGSRGAFGMAVEYTGSFVRNLSIEGRMTLCNLSIETGSRLGIVGPDEVTYNYLRGRPYAPKARYWNRALAFWNTLATDEGAEYEREFSLDVSRVDPMVTWGTNTENAVPITGSVPDPSNESNPEKRAAMERSLRYMGLSPGMRMMDISIDHVFIGSCANSTIDDMRDAASILKDRRVVVPTLIVPGSGLVKAQSEAEGLAKVFLDAGARWGEAGCSMCNAMNGDVVPPGERCASTANRNHVGRQGKDSRTHLVSPAMAAAAAVTGRLTDVRKL